MIILGIDPGYGRLGYAILKKTTTEETLVDCSCIETFAGEKHENRIAQITKKIESIVKKHKPDILSIESLFFTTNQKTALKVAEIRGIIIYIGIKNKMKIKEYTPLQVKTAVCGYGKASKEQVKSMVNNILGNKRAIKYDDTSDAIALCLTCVAHRDYIDQKGAC